jgi:hypothetical protein
VAGKSTKSKHTAAGSPEPDTDPRFATPARYYHDSESENKSTAKNAIIAPASSTITLKSGGATPGVTVEPVSARTPIPVTVPLSSTLLPQPVAAFAGVSHLSSRL